MGSIVRMARRSRRTERRLKGRCADRPEILERRLKRSQGIGGRPFVLVGRAQRGRTSAQIGAQFLEGGDGGRLASDLLGGGGSFYGGGGRTCLDRTVVNFSNRRRGETLESAALLSVAGEKAMVCGHRGITSIGADGDREHCVRGPSSPARSPNGLAPIAPIRSCFGT